MDHGDVVPIAELLDERRYLLDVAYWMLGNRGEAECVVDETYRRWYGLSDAGREQITAPRSWLAKTAGGICLGRLVLPGRGAGGRAGGRGGGRRTRAADGEGPWAVVEGEVSRALLDALDSVSPAERAAFVLNDVFGMTSGAIADIVGRTEAECAELAHRVRRGLRAQRSLPTTPERHDSLARAVRDACAAEDAALLASLLSPDATAFFDGGGKVRALAGPVHGSRRVAHSLLTLLADRPRTTLATHSVNGRTGLVVRYDRQVAAVISLDIADRHIAQVWVTLNPDKLDAWNHTPETGGSGSGRSPAHRGDGWS
ncbi:sigma factor-like helix-turn-helix DNA-binding protein [Streptomyces luomodiensis]|uniref:Sigma factor-like helix-turn-helix DNA-binding protein n=1 Tax=Streptomyces luomodiensis TaxID=3026192 RepID=A0ABY9V753_9ACTN|nr:sigma factor-like helix-turn-helix DNA-binding protein [Streptomyces sp. SCA4-21]WNE99734.1 sigma factor-like helix-turn-helix DNA-binding protein [Streptomyces sp. SCA4-21]